MTNRSASGSNETGTVETGIVVYRASRLEALLDPLEKFLQEFPPAQVLAPQTLIAAHPGMKYWLVGALARRRARGGIVANLRILLASSWLDELAQSLLGNAAIALAAYRREPLRWRIHGLLETSDAPEVATYLRGSDAPRRRFQLADRLAGLYTQYMVYRPDWLRAWQDGRAAGPASFQADVWRQLRLQIAAPHRAERLTELVGEIERRGGDGSHNEPLHVFGLSHLAPAELHVLRAVARHRLVILYVPDPCREYWGGLRGERAQLQALARLPIDQELQHNLLQLDHPLLASWGRMGQHFVLALNEGEDQIRVDTRHWEDRIDAPASSPLLIKLQESVRRLHDDAGLLTPRTLLHVDARADASLRIHACHTRLRELEVLRDALLMAMQHQPDLQPADIVVMAPDIHSYLPLVPAIFGEAGRHGGVLPYHFADVAMARSHPVFDAFLSVLRMPSARITAAEVIDLLQVPVLARTLGIDVDEVEKIADGLRAARVAWGLDAEFRGYFDVPEIDEHTFAWGMDRMLAGHVFGVPDDPQASPVFDGLWPLAHAQAIGADALGALDRLLIELAALNQDSRQPRAASAWVTRLLALLDRLFGAATASDEDRDALAQLRGCVLDLGTETAAAEVDPELDFSVVRDLLNTRLASAPAHQRLLLGGITFCGMVPQRAIPFRMIAVLGLNEGDYPRAPSDAGLDLMQKQRRLGDRDVRDDDRYLFLETLMAAREFLHLSYIGERVRDARACNPAAPLAELMQFLDGCAAIDPQQSKLPRPWLVKHPLQPFDPRYFDGRDAALMAFSRNWLPAQTPVVEHRPESMAALSTIASTAVVSISRLQSFYKDPARAVANGDLLIRLDALEDGRLAESEALDARADAIDRIGRQLLLHALKFGAPLPETAPDSLRLTGLLPAGRMGEQAYARERAVAQGALDAAKDFACLRNGLPDKVPVLIDRELAGRRWQGRLDRVYASSEGWLLFDVFPQKKLDALSFKERIPLFIEWLLLQLHLGSDRQRIEVCLLCAPDGGKSKPSPLPNWVAALNDIDASIRAADADGDSEQLQAIHDDLEARLDDLLRLAEQARAHGLRYFPQTSWAALSDDPDAVGKAWSGSDHGIGERDYAPGYAAWMARDIDFETGSAEWLELTAIARELHAILAMEPRS